MLLLIMKYLKLQVMYTRIQYNVYHRIKKENFIQTVVIGLILKLKFLILN